MTEATENASIVGVAIRDLARLRTVSVIVAKHGFGPFLMRTPLGRRLFSDKAPDGDAAMKELTAPVRFAKLLATLGPTFIKLGQILSIRPDLLPPAILGELTQLQDQVSPLPFDQIESQLRTNLGNGFRELFTSLDETPLASASIAQVHRATLKDGTHVVLKIQRPGLRPKIESDLNILRGLAGYVEDAFEEAAAMDIGGVIRGFAKSLAQELDFRCEARNMARFRRNFADNDRVRVPVVQDDLSTSEVICMQFVEGRKFSEVLASGEDTRPLVEIYFKTAYKMLFVDGFFHGDLHPGNVFVQADGGLAIIDCGMVGRLSPSMKEHLIDILYAVLNEDLENLARYFYALAIPSTKIDYAAFEADVIEIAERYLGGIPLSELQIGELFGELVQGATRHRVRMPSDFTMMFKAIVTTEGLAKSIAPDIDPIELARPFITQMITERYSSDNIKQLLVTDFQLLSKLAHSLPRVLPAILSDIKDGNLAVGIAPATLKAHHDAFTNHISTIVRAALTVTFLGCGTYCLALDLPMFGYLGIPWASVIFYVLALYGLFRLR